MKYEVLIMPSAEGELEAAYRWIYERAPEAAVAWYSVTRFLRSMVYRVQQGLAAFV